jgi:hypothetical protein
MSEPENPEREVPPESDGGVVESAEPKGRGGRRLSPSVATDWEKEIGGLSGEEKDGMPRRDRQRKHGTTRGSPRSTGTAKASRITSDAGKSRRACEWGGWGRLSVDGPGQNNPDRSEGPWGRADEPLEWRRRTEPGSSTPSEGSSMAADDAKDGSKLGDAVMRRHVGRPRLKCQPWSRTGDNPPYGILGGAMETSASFEARSAPSPHPTRGRARVPRS